MYIIILHVSVYLQQVPDLLGNSTDYSGPVMSDMVAVYLSWKDPINSNGIVRFFYIRIFDTKTDQKVKNLVNKTAMKQLKILLVPSIN